LGPPQVLKLVFLGVMIGADALVDLFLLGLNMGHLQGLGQGSGLLLHALCIPGLLDALLSQPVAGPKQARSQEA
jgi:hypothetical protein